jgi:IS5 family transposase
MSQMNFMAEDNILQKLSAIGDPLESLNKYVDWDVFAATIVGVFNADHSRGGRPPFDRLMMWKLLILQRIYNISDDQAEYQIVDRLSFRRFLGLSMSDTVPDAKTIWLFRETLVNAKVIECLFQLFYQELDLRGIVAHEGSINDASFVETPKRRAKKGDNEYSNRQIDDDAKWTKKGNVSYFGYKNHVKVDTKSKIITDYDVTPANTHDSQVFTQFYSEYENDTVYADSAYVGQELPENITPKICERAYRNKPLTDEQKVSNCEKSRVRVRIEHVFGFVEGHMHGSTFRGKSIERATFNISLTNLIYNVERYVFSC